MSSVGQLRVGKIYSDKGKDQCGKTEGFRNVIVKNYKTGLGWTLSPYFLRDEQGRLMENLYQASKVYPHTSAQDQYTSRFQHGQEEYSVWRHPAETHLDASGEPTQEYWAWRKKLEFAPKPVRYPNGYRGRQTCKYSLLVTERDTDGEPIQWRKLNYIEGRKLVYCRLYADMIKLQPEFHQLKAMYQAGAHLQIMDVDGPVPGKSYPHNLVKDGGIEITEPIIKALLIDTTYPFGHGFVLAVCLMDKESWLE